MYFVTLCTTTSAPSSRGRWSAGVANVLSTTTRTPAACAVAAAAARSTIRSHGFVGVSTHTYLVVSRIAPASASGSVRSHTVTCRPQGSRTFVISRCVPP
jgi:hypothetical protein